MAATTETHTHTYDEIHELSIASLTAAGYRAQELGLDPLPFWSAADAVHDARAAKDAHALYGLDA